MNTSYQLLSVHQAYKALGLSSRTFSYLIETKKIGFIQIKGRKKIPKSELDRYIKDNIYYYEGALSTVSDVDYVSAVTPSTGGFQESTATRGIITNDYFNNLIKESSNG